MIEKTRSIYDALHAGGIGIYEQPRGLTAVWGKEAEQFLNGLITNDVAKLADGDEMSAAFPNAKGRLLAVVRVRRLGDRFLFETEAATREAVYNNLFRFTFAGDFFVEDLSEKYKYFEVFGDEPGIASITPEHIISFTGKGNAGYFVDKEIAENVVTDLVDGGANIIDGELYETLRIERGIPLFGVDMDETTIVPELGGDGMISYNKGCYIGQEIIARIHFRGHVAKQLTGLVSDVELTVGGELTSAEEKPAGKITSATFSPKLDKHIAMAYVRYEHLADGTMLLADSGECTVKAFPLV